MKTRTIYNVLAVIAAVIGAVFVLGCGENPWLAIIGVALIAPASLRCEYLEEKKRRKCDKT